MIHFSRKVSVYVPTTRLQHVQAQLRNLTKIAGGSTMQPAVGQWYDDGAMHLDNLHIYSWCLSFSSLDDRNTEWVRELRDLFNALLAHGEVSVYGEHVDHGTFFGQIVFSEDMEQFMSTLMETQS